MLTISIGAFIGVIKLSIAGVKYAMSDVVTDKSSAKKDIMGVFLGLAILLVPFIVLKQINPDLVNLELLKNAGKLDTSGESQTIRETRAIYNMGTGDTNILMNVSCAGKTDAQCIGYCDASLRQSKNFDPSSPVTITIVPDPTRPDDPSRRKCNATY